MELLTTRFGNENPKESESFKQELQLREKYIKEAQRPVLRAHALNEKAWLLATFGVDLSDAEAVAREGMNLYGQSGIADISNIQDTLAYILMQMNRLEEAETLLSEAAKSNDEDVLFHYGLALWMRGSSQKASTYISRSLAQNYSPSHELYLLRGRIPESGEIFKLIELAGRNIPRPPAKRCPSAPPS
jgi:tetratricopeptide (TPR) repeat protein